MELVALLAFLTILFLGHILVVLTFRRYPYETSTSRKTAFPLPRVASLGTFSVHVFPQSLGAALSRPSPGAFLTRPPFQAFRVAPPFRFGPCKPLDCKKLIQLRKYNSSERTYRNNNRNQTRLYNHRETHRLWSHCGVRIITDYYGLVWAPSPHLSSEKRGRR